MACNAITNYLANETSRLGPWMYEKRYFKSSPWASLVTREQWPENIGYDFRQLTYERAAPTSILSWTSANALSAGEDCGACDNSFNAVDVGYTTRTCTLYKYEVMSREFCIEDLRPVWETRKQLEAIRGALGDYVRQVWDQRKREDTFLATKYKVVADGTLDGNYTATTATAYPSDACPVDVLQQATLDSWYDTLVRDGAAASGQYGMDSGAPIIPLVCSSELSRALLVQNSDARNDLRYATPGELLKPMSVRRIFRGIAHVIDPFPRRFNCVQGAFTEIAPFTSEAKTVLTGAEVSSTWKNAPYEEATLGDIRELWTQLVPRPITSPGAGTSFGPNNYMGDFVWRNIAERSGVNIFNKMGRWYGELKAAKLLVRPEMGASFVYRRCNSELAAIPSTCNYS